MKILIILKSIDGGTGTFLQNFLKFEELFKKYQIKVVVFDVPSFRKNNAKNIDFVNSTVDNSYGYSLSLDHIYKFIKELLTVNNKIKSYNPDIIIGVDVYSNVIISLIRYVSLKKFKIILTTHIDLNRTIKEKSNWMLFLILKKLVTFFYNKADLLVCISKDLADDMKKSFNIKEKIHVIYYGINRIKRRPQKKLKGKKIILSVGRLVEQKDHKTLILAFKLLLSDIEKAKLWIVGDGPEREFLKKLVSRLNLDEKIEFKGWQNDLNDIYDKSKIFVLSSKREGFGYVLLEAMEWGVPIVSTNATFGPREVLSNGKYGKLTKVGDVNELKKAIHDLLSDKKEYSYFSSQSLRRVDDFSVKKMLNEYEVLISKILP